MQHHLLRLIWIWQFVVREKKDLKKANKKTLAKTHPRYKLARASSAANTRFLAKSSKGSDVSRRLEEVGKEEYVSKLPVLHFTIRQFHNVVNYQTYSIVNTSHRYNKNLTARTGKYVERMESMKKLCMFDDCSPTTTLHFLDQVERSRGSDAVSEERPLLILSIF